MVFVGGGFTSGCPLCKRRVFDLLESDDLDDDQFETAFVEHVLKVRQEHAQQRYELELQAAQRIRRERRGRTITRGHLHLVRCEDATS